jgi:small subunit ribosomal protein S15
MPCGELFRARTCAPRHAPSTSHFSVLCPIGSVLFASPAHPRAHPPLALVCRSQPELNALDVHAAIQRWQRRELDTGSSEVQIAIFTERLKHLSAHMISHPKDKATKRRLVMLVAQRSRMLRYLRRTNREQYDAVIAGMGIRPTKAFDDTLRGHKHGSTTSWAAKGLGKYTPKKRKPRAKPYGDFKTPKGQVRMRKHAVRQRRLEKARKRKAANAAHAAAVEAEVQTMSKAE